jgi:hypothetical protein
VDQFSPIAKIKYGIHLTGKRGATFELAHELNYMVGSGMSNPTKFSELCGVMQHRNMEEQQLVYMQYVKDHPDHYFQPDSAGPPSATQPSAAQPSAAARSNTAQQATIKQYFTPSQPSTATSSRPSALRASTAFIDLSDDTAVPEDTFPEALLFKQPCFKGINGPQGNLFAVESTLPWALTLAIFAQFWTALASTGPS